MALNFEGISPAAQLLLLTAGAGATGYAANKLMRKKRDDVKMSPLKAALLAATVPAALQGLSGTGVFGNARRWGKKGILHNEHFETPTSDLPNIDSYKKSFLERAQIPGSEEATLFNSRRALDKSVDLSPATHALLNNGYLPRSSMGNVVGKLPSILRGTF